MAEAPAAYAPKAGSPCGRPGYCDASGGCGEYIQRVQIGEIDNSSGCNYYADYTALVTKVQVGVSYQLTVTNGTPGANDLCAVWVDWDQNAVFDDYEPEWIGVVMGGGGSPPYSFTLTVPPDAVLGPTRMRIRIDWPNPWPDPQPCGEATFGEVEDYSLLVVGGEPGACCNITDGRPV